MLAYNGLHIPEEGDYEAQILFKKQNLTNKFKEMAKKPSEMNVVDRIFHDIALHGIDSVIKNKDFYKNYKTIESCQADVIKSVCPWHNTEVSTVGGSTK